MDIRSLIESDPPAPASVRPGSVQRAEAREDTQQHHQSSHGAYEATSSVYNRPQTRPQPPPLQPPTHSEIRSPSASSYDSVHSPYQHTPTTAFSGAQYPFPPHPSQSPAHTIHHTSHGQREGHTTAGINHYSTYNQTAYLPPTPTSVTPGNSYAYTNHPSQQSHHPLATPTSIPNHSASILAAPSEGSQGQKPGLSQSYSTQQHSQAGTPLGPPLSFGRSTSTTRWGSPNQAEHHRSHSGDAYTHQQTSISSPQDPAHSSASSSIYDTLKLQLKTQSTLGKHDRERSLSVSPKTKLPNHAPSHSTHGLLIPLQPKNDAYHTEVLLARASSVLPSPAHPDFIEANNNNIASEKTKHPKEISDRTQQLDSDLQSKNKNTNHLSTNSEFNKQQAQAFAPSLTTQSSQLPSGSIQSSPPITKSENLPTSHAASILAQITREKAGLQHTSKQSRVDIVAPPIISKTQLLSKCPRLKEIPIYAQSIRKSSKSVGIDSFSRNPRQSALKPNQSIKPLAVPSSSVIDAPLPETMPPPIKQEVKPEISGHGEPKSTNFMPSDHPIIASNGTLGPWEPSITNVEPSEEVVRVLSDFLYAEVVSRDDVSVGPAGGGVSGGAVLEIEAKIGQLIDKNTNDRLRLPIMTECVISQHDPSLRIAFKSSMTEAQHRSLNGFLNSALVKSQVSKQQPQTPINTDRPRVPMTYVHTYECDSFYELSQSAALSLPASIRGQLNPRHSKAKIRVTTDQKTGKELAKIVKVRVADIDVYSPRTAFDWRVSINVEMKLEGAIKTFSEPPSNDARRQDRNKDRMSYKHLAYQIDLTQVTPTEGSSKSDKEHELEIEISSAEVRRQGLLAMDRRPNDYVDLVRGFVNNIRLLARQGQ